MIEAVSGERDAQPPFPPEKPPEGIDWWHQLELPGGYVTPGPDVSADKLEQLRLPSFAGKTVLDIGAWDGYFSFAAERLGASRVLAADSWAWQRPRGKEGFEFARRALGSSVEDIEIEVLDISPETVGQFDVVLFLGVLYHMRHPLLALERVASVTQELLVMETLVDLTFLRTPAAAFYPWSMLRDHSNWWGPNRPAVEGMLRTVGFERVVSYPSKRLTRSRLRRAPAGAKSGADLVSAASKGARLRLARDIARNALMQGRLVSHAWK
jgi:tRNA (mo5U34)-methyltransferase